MEKLKNHSGQNSMLVLRPADVYETTVAYKIMMENTSTPTGMILSRQNIKDLPGNRLVEAEGVAKGAYVVIDNKDSQITLLASGSEVSTLAEASEILKAEGINVRLVSVPSEGLFRSQSKEYQESVLKPNEKRFGLTAGLPCNLAGLVGENGVIFGLESFGFSAPYKVLDEKLGFTPAQVAENIKKAL